MSRLKRLERKADNVVMAITPESLDNQERGVALITREKLKSETREEQAAFELKLLKDRIASVKATRPKDSQPHCGDCYRRGWAAAIVAIEGG